jgi:hypothetical protein
MIDDIVAKSAMEVAEKPLAAKAFMAAMAGAVTNPTLSEVAQNHNADVIAKYEEGIPNGIKRQIDSGHCAPLGVMLVAATRGIVAWPFIRKGRPGFAARGPEQAIRRLAPRIPSFHHKSFYFLPIATCRTYLLASKLILVCQQGNG